MAEKDKTYMPQSGAGLMRYFDVEEKVALKPEHIMGLGVAFAVIVLILKFAA